MGRKKKRNVWVEALKCDVYGRLSYATVAAYHLTRSLMMNSQSSKACGRDEANSCLVDYVDKEALPTDLWPHRK